MSTWNNLTKAIGALVSRLKGYESLSELEQTLLRPGRMPRIPIEALGGKRNTKLRAEFRRLSKKTK